ncbi:MAG: ABC transporter substrate-binding protein [Muribaculaceae bacterium]|nr:ABC transporter substrate-binding protein [Muribaculaceae bacterium]MDE6163968.1 ABC transporter substrate-binding protein [Muribaculaceae bacterium]MDE6610225.1 ABC transporter substrate-binding protein [Muribaculaceae bacterium]
MSLKNRYYIIIAVTCLPALLLGSCAGRQQSSEREGAVVRLPLDYARNLRLYSYPDGWTEAEIVNPWDTTKLLQRVAMVPDSLDVIPSSVPDGATVVRTPLSRSLVTTSMHLSLLSEFGAEKSVAGVTDAEYIYLDYVRDGIKNGDIVDCGVTTAPTIERVISISSDGIMISPFESGGDYGKLVKLGIPIIYTADYMEPEPLGRAEWMRYYGMLFGKEALADSMFSAISAEFIDVAQRTSEALKGDSHRPIVLFDLPYQGVWYVNCARSINTTYVDMAGGDSPFGYIDGKTEALAPEKVVMEAGDADVWLIRYNNSGDLTRKSMLRDNPMVAQFKAFKEGNVYVANTGEVRYFEESPFHPERLLGDIAEILHPTGDHVLRYFCRISE